MSLANELSTFYDNFHKTAPTEMSATIKTTTKNFKETFDPRKAIQVGSTLPTFRLKDATGKEVTSHDLLANDALLISFYRGEWCPFCNIELRALQKHLHDFKAKGVNLVAISPELPDQSLTTTEKNGLEFTVLSDVGNKLARQLGILFAQPDAMRPVFETAGVDWKARYGDDAFEVPVPVTLLVDKTGIVRNTHIDADYSKRLEPATALDWIDAL